MKAAGRCHGQARYFGNNGAETAVTQPFLEARQQRLVVAGLDIDDAPGKQAGLRQGRRSCQTTHQSTLPLVRAAMPAVNNAAAAPSIAPLPPPATSCSAPRVAPHPVEPGRSADLAGALPEHAGQRACQQLEKSMIGTSVVQFAPVR